MNLSKNVCFFGFFEQQKNNKNHKKETSNYIKLIGNKRQETIKLF